MHSKVESEKLPVRNAVPRSCLLLGMALLTIVIIRLIYDIKTYFYGSTIIFHRLPSEPYDYLLHLPKGYHDFGAPRPLLIYLHGAGEVGKDVRVLDQWAPYAYLDDEINRNDFPFVVVCPITPTHGWDSKRVITFLDQLLADHRFRYRLDPDRVYLTGLSMGGFGSFSVACDYPDRFAAIAPLAGGGDPEKAKCLSDVPVWAFHDEGDKIVAYECTSKMIDAMNAMGESEVKFTTLHDVGHDIAPPVYAYPELYRWLLEHKKNHN